MRKGDKKPVIAIGASGLVGSRVIQLLEGDYNFILGSIDTGIDITKKETLKSIMSNAAPWVIHFAAKTDVDSCEQDKSLGAEGMAWQVNVLGTQNVVDVCKIFRKSIIYISTDFVFDGENTPENGYTETDSPNPINWYAVTKLEGEKIVQSSGLPFIIMRIAYPYRKKFAQKLDFVRAILGRLSEGKQVAAVTDHIMTPTFIDDIAFALRALINNAANGIYHVVGSQALSPYEACLSIARVFGMSENHIIPTTRAEFFKGRAPRPFNLHLRNDRIRQLGVSMRTFEEGLRQIKSQISDSV